MSNNQKNDQEGKSISTDQKQNLANQTQRNSPDQKQNQDDKHQNDKPDEKQIQGNPKPVYSSDKKQSQGDYAQGNQGNESTSSKKSTDVMDEEEETNPTAKEKGAKKEYADTDHQHDSKTPSAQKNSQNENQGDKKK